MKKILLILLMMFSVAYGEDIVHITELNTAETIYEKVKLLEARYPEILEIVSLGESTGGRPIYAVVLTEDVILNLSVSEGYVEKMHFFVETGIHSRENPGPNIIIEMIEEYAKDYYDDSVIPEYNVRALLGDNVMHFIPLSNPDGYNLATRGLYTIKEPYRSQLLSYDDQEFWNYKSNLNGVDLNRNFPNYYYDASLGMWRDLWNMIHNDFVSYQPSGAYYFGPYAGSEIETQLLMDYLLKYDFRNYLSFHSKGEIIFHKKWMLSENHNNRTLTLAEKIEAATGYDLGNGNRYSSSSGYLTDFTAMNTLKPSITVETVYWKETLPVTKELVEKAYHEVYLVPLIAVVDGREAGYFNYKWYVDGKYVRDYEEPVYAKAMYEKYGGEFRYYKGRPKRFLNENLNKVTRLELVHLVMGYFDEAIDISEPYLDCDDPVVLKAKSLGIISSSDYFRPDDFTTYEEVYVVLKQAFFNNHQLSDQYLIEMKSTWAIDSVKILLDLNIIDYDSLKLGRITLGELRSFLSIIESMERGE